VGNRFVAGRGRYVITLFRNHAALFIAFLQNSSAPKLLKKQAALKIGIAYFLSRTQTPHPLSKKSGGFLSNHHAASAGKKRPTSKVGQPFSGEAAKHLLSDRM
jgi:hypothetical protein